MALGFQARAQQRSLSRMGQRALLRGVDAGKVHIARNVAMFPGVGDTADDNMMARYTIVTVSNDHTPRVGDLLQFVDGDGQPIAGEAYMLDRLVGDNGYNSRYIVAVSP